MCSIFTYLLLIASSIPFITATDLEKCDEIPLPDNVDVKGCNIPPCILTIGTDVIMIMNFSAPADEPITALKAQVRAKVPGFLEVPYVLPNPDVCSELINTHCPLEVNEPAVYKLLMPISEIYPETDLILTFSILQNGSRNKLVCFKIKCKVVKPKPS